VSTSADELKKLRKDLVSQLGQINAVRRTQAALSAQLASILLEVGKLLVAFVRGGSVDVERVEFLLAASGRAAADIDKVGATAHNLADHHYRLLDKYETHMEQAHPGEAGK
jgi:hypothetical protein